MKRTKQWVGGRAWVMSAGGLIGIVWMALAALPMGAEEAGPVWKTAYVKRGFVGDFKTEWGGGAGATQRMRTPLAVDGTQVKVFVEGYCTQPVVLWKMALLHGKDDAGAVDGDAWPITFAGIPKPAPRKQSR